MSTWTEKDSNDYADNRAGTHGGYVRKTHDENQRRFYQGLRNPPPSYPETSSSGSKTLGFIVLAVIVAVVGHSKNIGFIESIVGIAVVVGAVKVFFWGLSKFYSTPFGKFVFNLIGAIIIAGLALMFLYFLAVSRGGG